MRRRFTDTGAPLENPGIGWVFHHFDNGLTGYGAPLGPAYDGRDFPGLTTVYLRLAWSHLEPEPGRHVWSVCDTVIARYAAAGKRFALRFTVFEGDPKQGTPDWVRRQGAKGRVVETFGVRSWEPDYDDPVFLKALGRFLRAAGKRYGSSPRLAFVDVGTLGLWGEGHPIGRRYGLATLRRHIDLHRDAFPKAILVAQDDWNTWLSEAGKPTPLELSRRLGLAFRDDSLNVYPDPKLHYAAHLARPFWSDRPVILEMGHYDYAKRVGAWGGERYLQAVRDYRASYVSVHAMPPTFLAENRELVAQINRVLGYRLLPESVALPERTRRGDGLTVSSAWRNVGVAPCLPGGRVAWHLVDGAGATAATVVDDGFDVRSLAPGAAPSLREARLALPPDLAPGRYTVRVSVGGADAVAEIALPLPDPDARRRHEVGVVQVEA